MISLLPVLALLVVPSPAAPAAADTVEGSVPEEIDAFRRARERYAERMRELDGDTRDYVALREAEEKGRVDRAYAGPIQTLSDSDRAQRELAIGRFETFLATYPSAKYASHVRFRLAELYFEKATELWQEASASYFAKIEDPNTPVEELEELEAVGAPKRDLSGAVALYDRIVEDNRNLPPEERYERLDGTFLMLGFVYNDLNSAQYDPAKARDTFADLIRVMPGSELADRSHLFLGNFAFAENQFDQALAEYRLVYDKGVDGKYYEEALYQLAWAHYKLNEFDTALDLFTQLLDGSEQKKTDSGRESSFAPDARRFMAFSLADIAYDQDEPDAVGIAKTYFAKVGERPYERTVYEQLADVLIRYTRPEEAVVAYDHLQNDPRWTLEAKNPTYQISMIDLFSTSVAKDLARAGEERLEFIERYSEGAPWWEANRDDPEALEVARKYIEGSLLDVAIEYRVRAQESGRSEDFLIAAAKYQEYLEKFPISDDYYKEQYYLADSLKQGREFARALTEFESLLKSRRYHPYGDAARYSLMDLRIEEMKTAGHAPDQAPTDAPVERTYTLADKTLQVFGLTPDRAAFVAAADDVLGHTFVPAPPELADELADYASIVKEKRPSILYLTGQILHFHNRFDESRPRLQRLIDEHHNTIEANYAAGLLVDSYTAEGNLQKVRELTKTFTLNPPGPPESIDPERFTGTLEGTTFKLALEEAQSGDPTTAAEAFLAFRKEFPRSQFGAEALYNAAYYYQQAGRVEDSNRLYEQFVAENPKHEKSKGLLFRIASNYEAAFELDKAIDYYDRLMRHPNATEKDKADAQFNKSFLQIGLGRHREAAEGYEAYERSYPAQEDKEQILFQAGEQWEKVSTADAIEFWNRYKKKYPDTNADRFIEAEYRLLQLYKKQGADPGRLRRQQDAIIEAFDRFRRGGTTIGQQGHKYAAAAEFPNLEKAFADYSKDKLTGNEERDAALLNETKPADLKTLEGQLDAFVSKYQNFEYNSGALLLKARAALYLADLGLSIKCPRALSEEECWAYEDLLQEKVFPKFEAVEDVGVKRLQELADAARLQKKHSRFIDEAQAELNRRRPGEFPAVKRELEGGVDSTMPPELVPLRMEPPPAPDPAPVPAPAPAPAPDGGTP